MFERYKAAVSKLLGTSAKFMTHDEAERLDAITETAMTAQGLPVPTENPAYGYSPSRAQVRAQRQHLRYRDRNTKFSKRSRVDSPSALHREANDKFLQFVRNPLLGKLLDRAGVFKGQQA